MSKQYWADAATQNKDVEYYFTVTPDSPEGNTGLAYDSVNDIIFVANYDSSLAVSKIKQYKTDGSSAGSDIDISAVCVRPQGIAYNKNDETFWVWAYASATNTTPKMYHINKSGAEISGSFFLPNNPTPNSGIDIHPITGFLWVRSGGESGYTNRIQVFDLADGTEQTGTTEGFVCNYG